MLPQWKRIKDKTTNTSPWQKEQHQRAMEMGERERNEAMKKKSDDEEVQKR